MQTLDSSSNQHDVGRALPSSLTTKLKTKREGPATAEVAFS
jgi:hypothetical protein